MNLQRFTLPLQLLMLHAAALEIPAKDPRDVLTPNEKKIILAAHNEYRRQAGSGDMRELIWGERLATDAQRWANVCNDKNKGNPFDKPNRRGFAGQNGYSCRNRRWILEKALTLWMTPGSGYEKIMSSRTFAVGCGYAKCKGFLEARIVCNYMPAVDRRAKPYQSGPSCSKCSPGFGFCNRNLCTRRCKGNQCKCTVDKTTCSNNGGLYDKQKCVCHCPRGKMGLNCEEGCSDKLRCDPRDCRAGTPRYMLNEKYCPWLCGFCELPCTNTNEQKCSQMSKVLCQDPSKRVSMSFYCHKKCSSCSTCKVDLIKCSANGGWFDRNNCLCRCPKGKTGENCETGGL